MDYAQDSVVDRLKSLSAKIEAAKRALEAQDKRLDALKSCTEDLGGLLKAASTRVERAAVQTQPLATSGSSSPQPASGRPLPVVGPKFVLPAVEEEERLRVSPDVSFYPDTTPSAALKWLRWAPYAALAAAGLAVGVRLPWTSMSVKDRSVAIVDRQAPLVDAVAARPAGPIEPLVPVDEETVDDVLQLVYSYRPKGSRETVIDMLGPEIDSATTAAPWMVERGERAGMYHATLRPYGETLDEAPVYEFDVDLDEGVVRAMPATESVLRGASVAARGR